MPLVGYWPLNENSGKAYDHSGRGNHGTVNGATQAVSGPVNATAYSFDGSNDFVKISEGVISGSAMTISAWINIDGPGDASWNRIIDVQDGSNANAHGFVWGEDDNRHGFFTPDGQAYIQNDIETGQWIHLTGIIDSSNAKFYKNAELKASTAVSTNFTDLKLCIGKRYDKNDQTNGRISEVRIYNRPLTQSEIQYLYSAGQRGLYTTSKKSS